MSTLRDLRETLDQHAGGIDDTERYVRPVAVRERIRVVRRRRATAAGVAAALVVAVAGTAVGTWGGDREVQPAGPVVVGIDVPQQITVQGFPYELTTTPDLSDDPRTTLDEADADRVVTLVARDLGGGSATLYVDDEPVARVRGDEELAAPVPAYTVERRLRVRLDGAPEDARVGLAVYTATGGLAPGVGDGEVVFPDLPPTQDLLAGAFSEPGEAGTEVTVEAALRDLRFAEYCRTETRGLVVHLSVDGEDSSFGACDVGDPVSPVAVGGTASFGGGATVREHVVRVRVTRGEDGPEVSDPSTVVGVGVYALPEQRRVLGLGVDETVTWDSRTWVLDRVVDQPTPGEPIRESISTADGDLLVGLVSRGGTVGVTWTGERTTGSSTFIDSTAAGTAASSLSGVLLAGETFSVDAERRGGGPFDGALLVYRPL